ncbi:MAG TPA: DoxX family protein [Steroidobacteraceae bacterium]|nr:DoxX family protein [Steroidobacteraceae bacterium]
MQTVSQTESASRGAFWTARALSGVVALFMLFDGVMHVLMPAPVVQAFARLGYPLSVGPGIGIVELLCTALYVVPRTSPLGAVLLTGVLGGAVSAHLRVGSPPFEAYIFPFLVGALVWGALLLRDARVRALLMRRSP